MSGFHKLSVKNITKETENAVSISFNLPQNVKDEFSFKAGQYVTLKTTIDDEEIRRDYSICVPPSGDEFKVAVKKVEQGTFSVYANNNLEVGDTLEVAPPNGRFIFEPNDKKVKNIAAFAAGSGITPIMSIIKCALQEEEQSKVLLIYGNKTLKDTMFLDELSTLQQKYSDRLFVQYLYSQKDEDNAIFGRIEKSTVNYVLKNKHKDIEIDAFYICGPEPMIHTVKDVLKEQGIHKDRIYFELFKASAIEKPPQETKQALSQNTKITVIVDDEETTFDISPKQTILEAALDKDLDAPYSCQGGICSSCLAKITEGSAEMRQNSILTESEIAEGLVLTCQAHPTTATITVDYDDV